MWHGGSDQCSIGCDQPHSMAFAKSVPKGMGGKRGRTVGSHSWHVTPCRKYLIHPIVELAAVEWFAAPRVGEIFFDAGEGGFLTFLLGFGPLSRACFTRLASSAMVSIKRYSLLYTGRRAHVEDRIEEAQLDRVISAT